MIGNPFDFDDPCATDAEIQSLGGELLTYVPGNGKSPWQFWALVDRGTPEVPAGAGQGMAHRAPTVTLSVATGRLPATLVNATTGDKVRVRYPTKADPEVPLNIVLCRRPGVVATNGMTPYDLT